MSARFQWSLEGMSTIYRLILLNLTSTRLVSYFLHVFGITRNIFSTSIKDLMLNFLESSIYIVIKNTRGNFRSIETCNWGDDYSLMKLQIDTLLSWCSKGITSSEYFLVQVSVLMTLIEAFLNGEAFPLLNNYFQYHWNSERFKWRS